MINAAQLATPRLLLLPGWQGSGPEHWQTHWEQLHGCERLQQDDWLWPRRGDWMAHLDEALQTDPRPTVLIAHSLGCHLVASWAAHSSHTACVKAALLVAPPDTERADMPPNLFSWRPIVRKALPFKSLVVISSDDAYCSAARADEMARDWQASTWPIGAFGHLNCDSQLADWPDGWARLQSLLRDR